MSAPVNSSTVTLASLGALTLNSSISGGTVVLNANGGIVETGAGRLAATTLTGSGASASLTGPQPGSQPG